MIRQICPHCQKAVEFPDEAAGTDRPCPECQVEMTIPARYEPEVDPTLAFAPEPPPVPAPPPGFRAPGSRPAPPAATPSGPPAATRGVSLSIDPHVLDWLPAGCFTLILLLTLLPWVGFYPGGHQAYSQGAWGATLGRFSTDSFAESVMLAQTKLDKFTSANWVMVIYLIGLIAAVALSWLDKLIEPERTLSVPRQLGFLDAVWPHRFPILAGLALGLLALLLIQTYAGFGLESGAERMVAAEFAERARAEAAAPGATNVTAASLQTRAILQGMELGKYEVHTTFWLGLAIGTHVVAVVAVGLRLWLYRRGTKPLPRIVWEG